MTKAKDIEIEVLGERLSLRDVAQHIYWSEQQTDEWFEKLMPAELEFLSTLTKWLHNGTLLPARCSYNHLFAAKAELMEEGCPVCEAARIAAETHVAQPIKMAAHSSMRAKAGVVKVKTYSADLDVLERQEQLYIDNVDDFEKLMDQLEKSEGYDMVHGLHAFEFKERPDLQGMDLLEAFLFVMQEKIQDDPVGELQPPQLSAEYFDWAERRYKRLAAKQAFKPYLSFMHFEERKLKDMLDIPLRQNDDQDDRAWTIKGFQQKKR